jgi:phage tail sheath protein FI
MIAARELARGPWIAPANVSLLGVIGLSPDFSTSGWGDLFNAQINLVRQLPGQYTLMSAHTLSLEDTFLQISVRRLLIFLRKLCLLRGMRYVFEANNERFRARVQASFEAALRIMMQRGAITAFEVVTDSSVNTQYDYDNGKFVIAIKVAPTQPIEFITVVLLRSSEDLLQVIEG